MNQWERLIVYIVLAIFGAIAHYVKKRYMDNTLKIGLKEYICTNRKASFKTFCACVVAAYGYAVVEGDIFALSTVAGVLSGGYVADSGFNSIETRPCGR
jgi:hypothetical protein